MTTDALKCLGLAKSAGKIVTGEDTVRSAAREHKVKLVILSCDAGSSAVKRASQAAADSNCGVLNIPFGKSELGAALGLTSVAIAGVTDRGFSELALKKLDSN